MALALEIYVFNEKGFYYECLISLEKCRDSKRYRCFVEYSICGSIRGMEVKDSKSMRL